LLKTYSLYYKISLVSSTKKGSVITKTTDPYVAGYVYQTVRLSEQSL